MSSADAFDGSGAFLVEAVAGQRGDPPVQGWAAGIDAVQFIVECVGGDPGDCEAIEGAPGAEVEVRGDEPGQWAGDVVPVPGGAVHTLPDEEDVFVGGDAYRQGVVGRVPHGGVTRPVVIGPSDMHIRPTGTDVAPQNGLHADRAEQRLDGQVAEDQTADR